MFGKIPDIICYIGYNKYLRVFSLADHSVVMYVWPNYFTNLLYVGHIGNMANGMATFSVAVMLEDLKINIGNHFDRNHHHLSITCVVNFQSTQYV